jgi:uncharacterized protein with FMN-binding domain
MEEGQPTKSGNNKMMMMAALAAIIILAAVAGGYFLMQNRGASTTVESNNTPESGNEGTTDTTEENNGPSSYKDGTYEAVGSYSYHSGTEEVGVNVTLANGIIEDVEVEQMAKAPVSKTMQADFAANYKTEVVGKNIDDVNLGKVSGSSLTPKGFNDALEQIKTEASEG